MTPMPFAAKLREHTSVWLHAFRKIFRIDTTLGAAGIAFFALFSVFPLILLIVAISSLWYDPLWVEGKLAAQMEFIIPGFSNLLGANFERIIKARSSVTQVASLVLIWSASSLFSIMARALDAIWHDIVDTRMHIIGGLGAIRGIEGFGPQYDLPNKEAYDETCAAVGNVLFNYRMFLLQGDAKYLDVAEVALFNQIKNIR